MMPSISATITGPAEACERGTTGRAAESRRPRDAIQAARRKETGRLARNMPVISGPLLLDGVEQASRVGGFWIERQRAFELGTRRRGVLGRQIRFRQRDTCVGRVVAPDRNLERVDRFLG